MFSTIINAAKVGFKYRELLNHPVVKMIFEVLPTVVEMATKDKAITLEKVMMIYVDIKFLLPEEFKQTATDVEVQQFVGSLFATYKSGQNLLK